MSDSQPMYVLCHGASSAQAAGTEITKGSLLVCARLITGRQSSTGLHDSRGTWLKAAVVMNEVDRVTTHTESVLAVLEDAELPPGEGDVTFTSSGQEPRRPTTVQERAIMMIVMESQRSTGLALTGCAGPLISLLRKSPTAAVVQRTAFCAGSSH